MTFDLAKILQSKREFRERLAARPIAEKLAMLDALRERELAIRRHAFQSNGVGAPAKAGIERRPYDSSTRPR